MAHQLWPGDDPIGQHVKVEWWHPTASVEIVGVVADSRHAGLDAEFAPTLFYPFAQESRQIRMSLVLRSTLPPATLTRMVRAAVSEMDKDVPVADAVTMYHHIAEMMADRRYPAFVLGLFAALALTLAAVGIYGVLSYTVGQRTREIGVRVALGARPADVLRTVLGGGLRLTLSGVALGGVAAALATRARGRLLSGVHPVAPRPCRGIPPRPTASTSRGCIVGSSWLTVACSTRATSTSRAGRPHSHAPHCSRRKTSLSGLAPRRARCASPW